MCLARGHILSFLLAETVWILHWPSGILQFSCLQHEIFRKASLGNIFPYSPSLLFYFRYHLVNWILVILRGHSSHTLSVYSQFFHSNIPMFSNAHASRLDLFFFIGLLSTPLRMFTKEGKPDVNLIDEERTGPRFFKRVWRGLYARISSLVNNALSFNWFLHSVFNWWKRHFPNKKQPSKLSHMYA